MLSHSKILIITTYQYSSDLILRSRAVNGPEAFRRPSTAAMEGYKHTPFDLEKPGFRLLKLLKGQDLEIKCELFQAWLDENDLIPYEALSYTWGGNMKCATILVNQKRLDVTENLYLALQYLRSDDTDRILWIDAVCIDQDDHRERGHQVQQMSRIYAQADSVIVWLGAGTDDTFVLMDSLGRLEKESIEYPCKSWKLTDERWITLWSSLQLDLSGRHWNLAARQHAGLKSLLEMPWFTRIWILQEVANAKRAVVYSGFRCVSARIFALAPLLLNSHPPPQVQAVLDIMPGFSRESSWWSQKRNLQTLLLKFRSSKASDPRDKIYALIGMCSEASREGGITVDYKKDLGQVISDATTFLFGKSDISCVTVEELIGIAVAVDTSLFMDMIEPKNRIWARNILERWEEQANVVEQKARFGASKFLESWEKQIKADIELKYVYHYHPEMKYFRIGADFFSEFSQASADDRVEILLATKVHKYGICSDMREATVKMKRRRAEESKSQS